MITTTSSLQTLRHLTDLMILRERAYYLRFGGDFAVIAGGHDACQRYSPALADELREAFKVEHEEYVRSVPLCYPTDPGMDLIGLATATPPQGPYVKMLETLESLTPTREFQNANALSYLAACKPEILRSFIMERVAPYPKMFVGSLAHEMVERLFGETIIYVKVPEYDAYDSIDDWWWQVEEAANVADIKVVLLAAGMSSRVAAIRLWNSGLKRHVLDLGSWIDAYAGKQSRSWIRAARANGVDFSRVAISR